MRGFFLVLFTHHLRESDRGKRGGRGGPCGRARLEGEMSAEVASSSIDAAAQLLLACPLRLEGVDAAAVVPARYLSAVNARMCDVAGDDGDDDGARPPSAQPAAAKPTLPEHREKLERLRVLRERLRRTQEREGLHALLALATTPADAATEDGGGGCDAARLRALTLAHALGGGTPQLRAAAEQAGQLALADEARKGVASSSSPSPKEVRRATLKAACRAGAVDAAGGGRPGFDPFAHLAVADRGGGDVPVPAPVVAAFHAARGRVLLGALRAAWGDAEEASAVAETQRATYPAQGLLGDAASLLASPEVFPACTVAAEAVQLVKILHLAAASAAAVAAGCSDGSSSSSSASAVCCRALLPVLLTQLARPLQLYAALRGNAADASNRHGGVGGGRSAGGETGLLVRHNSLLFLAANARVLHDALLHSNSSNGALASAAHDLARLLDASRVLGRAAAAALDSFAGAHTARVRAVLGRLYTHAGLEAPADAAAADVPPAAAPAATDAAQEATSPLAGGLLSGSSAQLVEGVLGGLSGATRHLGRDLRRGLQSTLFESEAGRRASEEAVERTLGQVVTVLRTLESELSEGASDDDGDGDGSVRRAVLGRASSVAVETIVDFVLRLAGTGAISATLGEGLARGCGYFQGVLRTWFVSEGERRAAETGAATSAETQRRLDSVVAATLERRVPALALFDDVLRVLEAPRMADIMRLREGGGGGALRALPTEHLVALVKALYEDSETRRANVALLVEGAAGEEEEAAAAAKEAGSDVDMEGEWQETTARGAPEVCAKEGEDERPQEEAAAASGGGGGGTDLACAAAAAGVVVADDRPRAGEAAGGGAEDDDDVMMDDDGDGWGGGGGGGGSRQGLEEDDDDESENYM